MPSTQESHRVVKQPLRKGHPRLGGFAAVNQPMKRSIRFFPMAILLACPLLAWTAPAAKTSELDTLLAEAKSASVVSFKNRRLTLSQTVIIRNKSDITVDFSGSQILNTTGTEVVLQLELCDRVTIVGGYFGHRLKEGNLGCEQGVISIKGCRNVTIRGADIFGCGIYGVGTAWSKNITVEDCHIHDNSVAAFWLFDSDDIKVRGCKFARNGAMYANVRTTRVKNDADAK